MPPLAELQTDFARAILAGAVPDIGLAPGRVPAADAMRVYRNTVIGGLVNALRLTYPTVDALLGEAFFDQAAAIFAATHPPVSGRLAGYGEGFIAFLAGHVPSLPYLADVARLDWAMERAAETRDAGVRYALDSHVTMEWPVSLRLLTLDFPADAIKAALGDDEALAAISLNPGRRDVLVWRRGGQVLTRAISGAAADFVDAMLAGQGAEAALSRALATSPDAPAIIQTEIFSATFCTIASQRIIGATS